LVGNPFAGFAGAAGSYPAAEAAVAPPQRQNRWKVGFRLLLVLPASLLAAAYGSVLWTAALLAWFAALITGRMPRRLLNTAAQALRYLIQVNGYLLVLSDQYPNAGPCRHVTASGPAPAPADLAFG